MNKYWFAITILFSLATFSLTSCAESDDEMEEYDINSTSDFALLAEAIEQEEEMDTIEKECFTITFPITVINPDNSTQVITTEGDLESYYEEWEDLNEDDGTIPSLMYPIEVTLAEGTVQSLDDEIALRALLTNCYGQYSEDENNEEEEDEEKEEEDEDDNNEEEGDREDDDMDDIEEFELFLNCFDIVLPVQITDGIDTISTSSIEELKNLYAQEDEIDYDLVFPLDLIGLSDNNQITVATEEEFETLEDACVSSQD